MYPNEKIELEMLLIVDWNRGGGVRGKQRDKEKQGWCQMISKTRRIRCWKLSNEYVMAKRSGQSGSTQAANRPWAISYQTLGATLPTPWNRFSETPCIPIILL